MIEDYVVGVFCPPSLSRESGSNVGEDRSHSSKSRHGKALLKSSFFGPGSMSSGAVPRTNKSARAR